MKAVIYARYSSDNQREESIEGQIRECTEAALLFEQFYRKAELLSICKPCNDLLSHLSHKDRLSGKTQKSKRKNLFGSAF